MSYQSGLILITGPPGVGKTTLVRKVCEDLVNKHNIICNGFYTEEVREPNSKVRLGFDVVTLSKKRGVLARLDRTRKGPFVGKYCVNVKGFEDIALPVIHPNTGEKLLVVDEVGKMELKSQKFEKAMENCIMKSVLLATVPYNLRQPLPFVDKLKNHAKAQLIVVTKENRSQLHDQVINNILKLIKI